MAKHSDLDADQERLNETDLYIKIEKMPERLSRSISQQGSQQGFQVALFFPPEAVEEVSSSPASLTTVFILRRYQIAVNSQEREGSGAKKRHERLVW